MKKTLRVPSFEAPTYFNTDMMTGAAIGVLSGALPIGLLAPLVITPVAAIAGGFVGKSRMEKEAGEGKEVGESSYLNGGIFRGGALGTILGLGVAVGVALLGGGLMGGLIALNATALAGAALGSISTQSAMEQEYKAAEAYVAQHGEFNKGQPKVAISRENVISPQEMQQLEEAMAKIKAQSSQVEKLGNQGLAGPLGR